MSNPKKLDSGQKHFMRLIVKDADEEGWATCSKPVYGLVIKTMPAELVEHEPVGDEGRGRARLTQVGQNILDAMEWL